MAEGETPERRLAQQLTAPVLKPNELEQLRAATERVCISEPVSGYIVELVRQHGSTRRSGLALDRGHACVVSDIAGACGARLSRFRTARGCESDGRPSVGASHPVASKFEMEGVEIREVINSVLEKLEVPR